MVASPVCTEQARTGDHISDCNLGMCPDQTKPTTLQPFGYGMTLLPTEPHILIRYYDNGWFVLLRRKRGESEKGDRVEREERE